MNVAVGEVVLLNCADEVEGLPASTVQAPVPGLAELAASVAEALAQIVWSGPAFAVAGGAFTVITMSLVLAVQGLLEIVQRSV